MKIGLVVSSSALVLLSLASCGGEPKASANPSAPNAAGANAANPQPQAAPTAKPSDTKQEPAVAPKKPMPPVRVDMVMAKALFSAPPAAPAVDNPSTPEKVALGKMLFHEKSLSKNGSTSCASCHDLANYGQDGKATSPGPDGKNGTRNTPTVYNASRQFMQFWDGRAASVEEQAMAEVLDPVGHGLADEKEVLAKLNSKPEIVAAFDKAFPGGNAVTAKNFEYAIGAFERTLVTRSKFEDALAGKAQLGNEEKLGLKTFMEVGCQTCHMGAMLGGGMFQKIGVLKPYPTTDVGRAGVTKSDSDKFIFKVPSLLNVEKTAPYYHDGKIATLEEAVKDMADYQLGKTLTTDQIEAIVAFLKTLTGPLPDLK